MNVESPETCNSYDVAAVDGFHFNVGVRETPAVSSDGDKRLGVAGIVTGGGRVEKLHGDENALVPTLFVAFTLQ